MSASEYNERLVSDMHTHTKGKPLEHVTQGIKAKEIKAGAASKGMPWQQGLC